MLMLLLMTPDALAWKHLGTVWESFPISWYLDDEVEESLPEGYDQQVLIDSWDNWNAVECASYALQGGAGKFKRRQDLGRRDPFDGTTGFYYNDPNDEAAPGVLGVTYTIPTGVVVKVANGRTYYAVWGSDIIFNDNVDFATTEDIANGVCNGESSIEGVATHEIGHMLGMGHSCEQGEACNDPDYKAATMFWSGGPCDLAQVGPHTDDIAGMTALYGPSVQFDAKGWGDLVSGSTPLDVSFQLSTDDDVTVTNALWNFGDGQTSTEPEPTHTYTTPGQYTVTVTVDGATPTCGDFNYTDSTLGMVTACGLPAPIAGEDGFFQMEQVEGLRWTTINHTDMSVFGCVDEIFWQVYEGDSITPDKLVDFNGDGAGDTIGAWSPDFEFPKAGTYTIIANVGGPAGTQAGKLTIEVSDSAGGCSSTPMVGSIGSLLVAGLAALRRRRT